jgi:hypothetical protein
MQIIRTLKYYKAQHSITNVPILVRRCYCITIGQIIEEMRHYNALYRRCHELLFFKSFIITAYLYEMANERFSTAIKSNKGDPIPAKHSNRCKGRFCGNG